MRIPKSLSLLRRIRNARLKRLQKVCPLISGSLVMLPRHNSRYLTDKVNGKTRTMYIPLSRLKEVTKWNEEYKVVRQLVLELSQLQRAILKAEIKSGK